MKALDLFENVNSNFYGVSGLTKELNCLYIYNVFINKKKNILVLINSLYEANDLYNRLLNYTENVLFFPMDDFITSEALAISPEFKAERINTLNKLINDENYIVVTNLMGYLRYLPTKEVYKNSIINLEIGMEINREELINKLNNLGYERESIVSETGKIGIRGYVLDLFPVGYDRPIRIEFWGDTIDSIKYFDVDTQISSEKQDKITIYPYTEFLLESYDENVDRHQKYLKHYANNISSLYDYIDDGICFYYDYTQITTSYKLLRENIMDYAKDSNELFKTEYMFDLDQINPKNIIFIMDIDNLLDIKLKTIKRYLSYNIDNYEGHFENVKKDIEKYLNNGKTIIFCIDNKSVAKRIINYLEIDNVILTDINNVIPNKINLVNFSLTSGFIFNDLIFISNNDLFGTKTVKKKYKNKFKMGTKISNIDTISRGDYIVHEEFGIGIYDELCTLKKNGIKKDYIRLIYADKDVLYIPVENIDRISKYSGKETLGLKLNKLGTDAWQRKKDRIRSRLENIAEDLLKLSATREAMDGFAFSLDDENQIMFEKEFAYEPTKDQLNAIAEIKAEMQKKKPMDMLLCGDVGYGKTEVAFRAIFKAVNDGKQVAYLCPTTILSQQQYKSAIERFSNFSINIALMNRFIDNKKQKEIIENLKQGKIDILFGTHRILSDDIEYKNLGLLVIDEEQRFGVKHKEKIKKYKNNIDVLTLSATPIPRTLQMSMSGIRSLALIETPPEARHPIQTYVLAENKNVIKDAIYKELTRHGQVYILFNNIDKIQDKVSEIKNLVPEARIDYAHGQMEKTELEDKMIAFTQYQFDVLVCTTIIETGIDISNVNTLIIFDADRFGLAQLYQIRGRIGRSDKIGYAYLMYDNRKMLNEIAVKRLNTIKEFTELGSGFKIAMRDLAIRGAGDILGSEQSGFIDTIGIELYLKLLKEAVDKLKGNEVNLEQNKNNKPLIEVDTHISSDYVDDENLKIEIHKKINEINNLEKLLEIKKELENRFGKISHELEIYMYEEWFEKLACEFEIVNVKQNDIMIELELSENMSNKIDGEKLFIYAYQICPRFKFSYKNKKIYIRLDFAKLEKHFLIYIIELLTKIKDSFNN